MSSASARSANASTGARQDEVTINGTTHRSANNAVRHRIGQHGSDNKAHGSLIDGGANGGLLGSDVRILNTFRIATLVLLVLLVTKLPTSSWHKRRRLLTRWLMGLLF